LTINEHIKSINEVRQRVWMEAEALVADIGREHRDMNGEEQAKWERLNARITELDHERDDFIAREQRENESAELRSMHPGAFGTDHGSSIVADEKREADFLRRWMAGDPSTPRTISLPMQQLHEERNLLRQGADAREIRALVWDTGSIASGVPQTTAREIYGYLEAEMGVFKAPSRKIFTDTGETMFFPKLTAHALATQVIAQGTVIGGSDPTFSRMQLDTFKFGEVLQASSETVTDTAFDFVSYVASDLARAVSRQLGPMFVTGTGSGQPQGLMSAAGTGNAGTIATGGTLITPTYEISLTFATA
jgi:HK97 family phage major capsid protein